MSAIDDTMTTAMTDEACVCAHAHEQHDDADWGACAVCPCNNWFGDIAQTPAFAPPLTDEERADVTLMSHGERMAFFVGRS